MWLVEENTNHGVIINTSLAGVPIIIFLGQNYAEQVYYNQLLIINLVSVIRS
jgi:hypothetical protein